MSCRPRFEDTGQGQASVLTGLSVSAFMTKVILQLQAGSPSWNPGCHGTL
jgi:hypothetical protein